MDIKKLEEVFEPSAMKMARENQARLDSLHLATGATDNLLKIAQNLDYSKKLTGNIAIQDLLSQLSESFPQNNLVLDAAATKMLTSLFNSPSINISALETLKLTPSFQGGLEAASLASKPLTQSIYLKGIYPESQFGDINTIISKATEVFKEYNQFSELESFKAISRLRNFPFEDIVPIDFTKFYETEGNDEETIFKMDSKISNELLSTENFEDLSSEVKHSLLFIVKNNYLKTIYYLAFYICMSMIINEGFSTDESFTLNDLQKMIHLVYEEFGNGIIASLLAGYIAKEDNEK